MNILVSSFKHCHTEDLKHEAENRILRRFHNHEDPIPTQKSPEKGLLAAVMVKAIRDYLCEDGYMRHLARSWFFDPDPEDAGGLTFDYVCEQLDMPPWKALIYIKRLSNNKRKLNSFKVQSGGL